MSRVTLVFAGLDVLAVLLVADTEVLAEVVVLLSSESPKNRKIHTGRSLENLRLEIDNVLDPLLVDMMYNVIEGPGGL